jgi:hypothetical protein
MNVLYINVSLGGVAAEKSDIAFTVERMLTEVKLCLLF